MSVLAHHKPRQLWKPRAGVDTQTDRFRRFVNQRRGVNLQDYHQLHKYSCDDDSAPQFWVDLIHFVELKAEGNLDYAIPAGRLPLFPPPEFFPGVKLSFPENLLSGRPPKEIAVHVVQEGGTDIKDYTWGELYSMVERAADALISLGVKKHDRVAAVLSNRLETVVLCLATLSIGAIWSSSSPDMGESGILDRLTQIKPKIVFGEASVVFKGKAMDLAAKNAAIVRGLEGFTEFKTLVVLPPQGQEGGAKKNNNSGGRQVLSYEEFLEHSIGRPLKFTRLPFSHPGFIVYSSGTSGAPKCIVHSAAVSSLSFPIGFNPSDSAQGLLLSVKKDAFLAFDVQPGDVVLQYTTAWWIMWAMVLCGLSYGGRTVIYDGSPLYPDNLVLLRLVEKLRINLLGISPRLLLEIKKAGLVPRDMLDLSSLRTVTSTGSILNEELYLACSLVSGNPTLPMHAGEIQCKCLGMAVDIAQSDTAQFESIESTGAAGQLVTTRPYPSEPLKFWGPGGQEKYYSSYFEQLGPYVWWQGDFIRRSLETGGYVVLGRSDGVLNPSGVRFGSAEIYEVLDKIPGIVESICVGQRRPTDQDEAVILFLVLEPGKTLTSEFEHLIKDSIKRERSPRHVPKYVFPVSTVPYTINGKKIEIAVKKIISGENIVPSGAVANPESFAEFRKFVNAEKMYEEQCRERQQRAKL
ncbi:hypothetical protein AYO20_11078 [Fonsecaea nubica]|uniref:Uncharacterized protein n=1 Tax=Fonsecaea nubica TaxID=856822 RepID=A0A178C0F9_9EURO|nr:hypothetical protein AYO20_11078 [Fonsecaea nubica]OAL23087.1 hypothetical protein AYO20_11078 [Fonsecaea nubica]